MSPSNYTEGARVQQAAVDYLEQRLGWKSMYAYNNEDFGPVSLSIRGTTERRYE